MICTDYVCIDCDKITEFWRSHGIDFPKHVECSHCNSLNTRRKYSIGHISVPAGNCGNAQNGYSSKK